jgi:hypothetical protein
MKWTRKKRAAFLDVVRVTGNISAGARAAGVTPAQAYGHRKKDEDFRAAWDAALEGALDDLEGALRRRAVDGVEKDVYYGGKRCGGSVAYSDSLGMFLLRGRRKEIFGEGRVSAAENAVAAADIAKLNPRERLMAKLQQMSDAGQREAAPDLSSAPPSGNQS